MDPFSLIEGLWWAGVPAAVLLGVLLGASPLAWPLLATATGVRAAATAPRDRAERTRADLVVLALGGGVTTVYAALGLLTGQLERVIRDVLGAWSGVGYVVLAVTAAAGGLALLVRPSASCRVLRRRPVGGPAAFALGIPLGIVNCPACAGVITGVAVAGAARGNVVYSVVIMASLGVGHTLALVGVSRLAVGAAGPLVRRAETIQRIGGALLLGAAVFFLLQVSLRGTSVGPTLP